MASDSSETVRVDTPSQGKDATHSWFTAIGPQRLTEPILQHHYPGNGTRESPYLVEFLPDDQRNAHCFSNPRKWTITMFHAIGTLALTFASSAYSGGIPDIVAYFDTSQEVAILGISLYVLGFAVGPLVWAPLSELYGRQYIFFFTFMALTIFNAVSACAPNISTLIVFRFLASAFGSSVLTNAGGVIADLFDAKARSTAASVFAMAPFLGPTIGPIAGGFLGEAHGWRWLHGLMAIFTGFMWVIISLTVPETYAPVLLRQRARLLSKTTGKFYISKLDAGKPPVTAAGQFKTALCRPWILLFREPIVLFTSIYVAILYGIIYMCFAAFPIIFQVGRGWGPGIGGLAFIGISFGVVLATIVGVWDSKRYSSLTPGEGNIIPPEARLPPALFGSVFIPAGLFWFAWTTYPNIHWIVPIAGSALFAFGHVLVSIALISYLIDAYVIYAASVLAANSVLRSLFGAAFPLFASKMYESLGNQWATSIPAFLGLLCLPCPFIFSRYGHKIRARCKYAHEAEMVLRALLGGQMPPKKSENGKSEAKVEEV